MWNFGWLDEKLNCLRLCEVLVCVWRIFLVLENLILVFLKYDLMYKFNFIKLMKMMNCRSMIKLGSVIILML